MIGNQRLMDEEGIDTAPLGRRGPARAGATWRGRRRSWRWTTGSRPGAAVARPDRPRRHAAPESAAALRRLKAMGLEMVMITGDNEATAEAIAREVAPGGEIDRVVAGVLPERQGAAR